jgi:hypothetical protein
LDQAEISVLLVIEGEIATTQLIERLLQASGQFGIRYRKIHLASLKWQDFERHTVPLVVRCGDPLLKLWVDLLRRAGHPYLYYIDDNFWELQDNSPVGRYYRDPDVRESLALAVSQASQVLTNSEVLALYLGRFSERLRVLPAFFDFSLTDGCVPEETSELRIGFAGSANRADDLELIRPIIEPVLHCVPNSVFEFCGAMPAGVRVGERVRFFRYTDSYADFIRFQASRNWAIGLAPLRDHEANRAKTNNKYREYGACGIAGVYSNIPPYQDSVIPGTTGLLADTTTEAWLSAILFLLQHRVERERIAMTAQQDVREKHCVVGVARVWADRIREAHSELLNHPSHLRRAYYGSVVLNDMKRGVRIAGLQVQDAFRKGGMRMVVSKTVQRVTSGLGQTLGRRRRNGQESHG